MHFIFFFTITLLILATIHFYIYLKCRNLFKNSLSKLFLKIIIFFGLLLFPISHILERNNSSFLNFLISYAGNVWLGFISISFFVFLCIDVIVLIFNYKNKKIITTISLLLSLLLSIYSTLNATYNLSINNIDIPIKNLPISSNGINIVQISDLHLNTYSNVSDIKNIVSKISLLNPDIVAITGDLIDTDFKHIEKFCEIFKTIKTKYGVFAVSGNHDYYSGINNFSLFCEKSKIEILNNSGKKINNSIYICGIADKENTNSAYNTINIKNIIKKSNTENLPVVLLSHKPNIFNESAKAGIELTLSGHLHAGQIPPIDIGLLLFSKYFRGIYKNGDSFMYLSAGTGLWGPPMRLLSKSEITKITLHSTDKNQ